MQNAKGADAQAVPAGVLDERGRRVETHRLAIEQRAEKLRRAVDFEPRARIREDGERDSVALGKAVEREGAAGEDDALDRLLGYAFFLHAPAQAGGDFGHALGAAMKAQCAAQLLRF